MPSIYDSTTPITEFPNRYTSPFGNDLIIPIYSSIPAIQNVAGKCMPCVVCESKNAFLSTFSTTQINTQTTITGVVPLFLFYTNAGGDNTWENLANWNTKADGTGQNPTEIPWSVDGGYTSHYSLADETGGAGITISQSTHLYPQEASTCYIPNISSYATITKGSYTGTNFSNKGVISGGEFYGHYFTNEEYWDSYWLGGVIHGGIFYNNGFVNGQFGTITGGTIVSSNAVNNGHISGGSFTGNNFTHTGYRAVISDGSFSGDNFLALGSTSAGWWGTYHPSGGVINGGTYSGNNFNNNNSWITDGTYSGTFVNIGGSGEQPSGVIFDGTFSADNFNNQSGYVYGGTYTGNGFVNNHILTDGVFNGNELTNNGLIAFGYYGPDLDPNTGYLTPHQGHPKFDGYGFMNLGTIGTQGTISGSQATNGVSGTITSLNIASDHFINNGSLLGPPQFTPEIVCTGYGLQNNNIISGGLFIGAYLYNSSTYDSPVLTSGVIYAGTFTGYGMWNNGLIDAAEYGYPLISGDNFFNTGTITDRYGGHHCSVTGNNVTNYGTIDDGAFSGFGFFNSGSINGGSYEIDGFSQGGAMVAEVYLTLDGVPYTGYFNGYNYVSGNYSP
jgi:hypothetical protein